MARFVVECFCLVLVVCSVQAKDEDNKLRQGKLFSLFSIVQFPNEGCQSTSSIAGGGTTSNYRNGTCFTASECANKGGQSQGSCAAGFGVCCLFSSSTCGAVLNQNCSYFRNPGFPNTYTQASTCAFTVNKCSNSVCQLRLDFETFSIAGPTGTLEATGGACSTDTFTTTTLNTGTPIVPTICGLNTGQHMYIDIGELSTDTAAFQFTTTGTTTNRQWEVKVTQIPCASNYKAPIGCLQYLTGCQGRITSYNFADSASTHLADQCYNVCIRQEEGMCCIKYGLCSDSNSFTLDNNLATTKTQIESECTNDFIEITGGSADCCGPTTTNRFCGGLLGFTNDNALTGTVQSNSEPICDCSAPFMVGIITDTNPDTASATAPSARGVCLTYTQVPCGQK